MKKQPVEFTRQNITFGRLPAELDGLVICHLSDIHSARYADFGELVAREINTVRPDLVLVTGDMMDCAKDRRGDYFFSIIDRLENARVFCSPGNHEKRIGCRQMPETLREQCALRGITLLDNRGVTAPARGGEVCLYGYLQEFIWFESKKAKKARLRQNITEQDVLAALGPCPEKPFSILLAHDPAPFDAYVRWGAPLILSGHIHGGQIRLPLVGGVLSPAHRFFPKYSAGLYRKGESAMYVSRGLSVSEMARVFNRPEVAFLTLRKGEDEG